MIPLDLRPHLTDRIRPLRDRFTGLSLCSRCGGGDSSCPVCHSEEDEPEERYDEDEPEEYK